MPAVDKQYSAEIGYSSGKKDKTIEGELKVQVTGPPSGDAGNLNLCRSCFK